MNINYLAFVCALAVIPAVSTITCNVGTITMLNNQNPQGNLQRMDCTAFVQYCTKTLLNQRQQNFNTLTTIVYGCDVAYSGVCWRDGCVYSANGGASCCCDSYLCNSSRNNFSSMFLTLICSVVVAGKLLF
ncbi:hypothetical protein Q1695_006884 [Nippostrongylus brasiliensis]|nr:hypothetical protein Q1695_006884 [Nippostrongylus brasiliensis]